MTRILAALARFSALEMALAVSLALHGLGLSIHFVYTPPKRLHDSGLNVILVHSRSPVKKPPRNAQALAQVNLDGGGNTEQDRVLSSPLPPAVHQQPGEFAERKLRKQVEELEATQKKMLTTIQENQRKILRAEQREKQESPVRDTDSGLDLVESYQAIARDMSLDKRLLEEYNKRPRKAFVGLRTQNVVTAQYIEDWRAKVRRIGTLNFPAAAKGRIYGSVIVTVTIDKNGELVELEIERPSQHNILNEAAKRIIRMGAPYPPLPPALLREMDQLSFTRTILFTDRDSVN
ncbi:MAG: TonB family protein [Zoogloeaceae bacterium]|jgi:protein TonB|nr:TonB family protein [Zoogloeaceae bacterium]